MLTKANAHNAVADPHALPVLVHAEEHLITSVAELWTLGYMHLPREVVLAAKCCLATGAVPPRDRLTWPRQGQKRTTLNICNCCKMSSARRQGVSKQVDWEQGSSWELGERR